MKQSEFSRMPLVRDRASPANSESVTHSILKFTQNQSVLSISPSRGRIAAPYGEQRGRAWNSRPHLPKQNHVICLTSFYLVAHERNAIGKECAEPRLLVYSQSAWCHLSLNDAGVECFALCGYIVLLFQMQF